LKSDLSRWEKFLAFGQQHSLVITAVSLAILLTGAGMIAATSTLSQTRAFLNKDGTVFQAYDGSALVIRAGTGLGIGMAAALMVCSAVALKKLKARDEGLRFAAAKVLLITTFIAAYCAFILVLERTATESGMAADRDLPDYGPMCEYVKFDDDSAFKAINGAASVVLIGGGATTGFGIASHFAAKKALKAKQARMEPQALNSQNIPTEVVS
jgi:hypothetical protein